VDPTKRKATVPPKSKSKKGKKADPASMVAEYETSHGKMMFGKDGRFYLTPAESAQAGLLVQKQRWFLEKASYIGLKDKFVFTQAFVDGCRKDEHEINVLGPVPGVDVMAKRSQKWWVKCEDRRLPYYRDSSCSLPLATTHSTTTTPRLATREDLGGGGGARGRGSRESPLERAGLLVRLNNRKISPPHQT
jgi:hypothetical protein